METKYNDWNNLEQIVNPTLIEMIGSMVDKFCYRQTEFHSTLNKIDFKMFALLKVMSSEIYKTADYEDKKTKSYIFKMIRNDIQDNYDKHLFIRKPYGKQKQMNRIYFNLEELNIDTNESIINGAEQIIEQIGMKDYQKLVELSQNKKLKSPEGRRIRRRICKDTLRKEI